MAKASSIAKKSQKMEAFVLRLPMGLLRDLRRMAATSKDGTSMAALIRKIIAEHISK